MPSVAASSQPSPSGSPLTAFLPTLQAERIAGTQVDQVFVGFSAGGMMSDMVDVEVGIGHGVQLDSVVLRQGGDPVRSGADQQHGLGARRIKMLFVAALVLVVIVVLVGAIF